MQLTLLHLLSIRRTKCYAPTTCVEFPRRRPEGLSLGVDESEIEVDSVWEAPDSSTMGIPGVNTEIIYCSNCPQNPLQLGQVLHYYFPNKDERRSCFLVGSLIPRVCVV